jgi:DNA-binding transcriptional ArsR family regulator
MKLIIVILRLYKYMGATKTEEFTLADTKVAKYAKALGHPARIAILKILLERTSCICGDIVEELPLSQSTVSQHLKELKEAGLIKGDIEGKKVCYCIDAQNWSEARQMLEGLFAKYNPCATACC